MIETRAYTPDDAKAFLTLYRACLAYYDVPPVSGDKEARIISLLDGQRHMSCLLAFDDHRPVGFATWALTFPAGSDLALFMKELFVDDTARGRGVGRAMMAALVRIAEAEGCCRFDWQTDGDNPVSQAFYSKIGAPLYEKVTYRVMSDDYEALLGRLGVAQ